MVPVNRRVLTVVAAFVIFLVILRAYWQSITIDEAFTYLFFATKPIQKVFWPSSNNHVLNSLLMWITTHVFGASNLTVRAPALLGAVIYTLTCRFLCQNISNRLSIQLPVFICLTLNPFLLDFMVAARGYSLAMAFLMAAIAIPVRYRVKGRPSLGASCGLASLALGFSFTASFSFAIVDGLAFLALLTWAIRERKGQSAFAIALWCALPGLSVALAICGYPLAYWLKNDLWDGSHSLREMLGSLVDSSFYQLNPRFQDSWWYRLASQFRPFLLPALGILCAFRVATAGMSGWRRLSVATLALMVTSSVTVNWIAFHFHKLPLPLGRTEIYLVPLVTLLVGIIAGMPALSTLSRWLRGGMIVVLCGIACYFVLCLRLSYFKEYEWDADMKDVYPVLARLNHDYKVTNPGVTGLYVSALNYYRVVSGQETFPEFTLDTPDPPPGRPLYVVSREYNQGFIKENKLIVIYRGHYSSVVIAVPSDGPVPPTLINLP